MPVRRLEKHILDCGRCPRYPEKGIYLRGDLCLCWPHLHKGPDPYGEIRPRSGRCWLWRRTPSANCWLSQQPRRGPNIAAPYRDCKLPSKAQAYGNGPAVRATEFIATGRNRGPARSLRRAGLNDAQSTYPRRGGVPCYPTKSGQRCANCDPVLNEHPIGDVKVTGSRTARARVRNPRRGGAQKVLQARDGYGHAATFRRGPEYAWRVWGKILHWAKGQGPLPWCLRRVS